jgi:hypothetical protein
LTAKNSPILLGTGHCTRSRADELNVRASPVLQRLTLPNFYTSSNIRIKMAPLILHASHALLSRGVVSAGPDIARLAAQHLIVQRGLTVNKTQGVTLGVIVVYVVAIALLWNLPYVRWSLWPFKVSDVGDPGILLLADVCNGCL